MSVFCQELVVGTHIYPIYKLSKLNRLIQNERPRASLRHNSHWGIMPQRERRKAFQDRSSLFVK